MSRHFMKHYKFNNYKYNIYKMSPTASCSYKKRYKMYLVVCDFYKKRFVIAIFCKIRQARF